MLNHPVTSVTNGARWRRETLLQEIAQEQRTTAPVGRIVAHLMLNATMVALTLQALL
ncbi:MAG: hypothetical protein QM692_23805 [Thermomicrobiales bacterium]